MGMNFRTALKRHFKFKGGRPGGRSYPLAVIGRHSQRNKQPAGVLSLTEMARDMEAHVGVEIGTYLGNWASLWCKSNPELHLTCIDPYRPYNARTSAETQEAIYQEALKNLTGYNATIVRKASMEAVDDFEDGSLDFVSIDGDHFFDAVIMDLVRWVPKVRKGGIVCVHDYTAAQGPHVILAVNAYTHCHEIAPWYATMDWTPTVFWEA
jgi:predicted O-methyltransferase YrrM